MTKMLKNLSIIVCYCNLHFNDPPYPCSIPELGIDVSDIRRTRKLFLRHHIIDSLRLQS